MKPLHLKLHPNWKRHTGHCQITYTAKNEAGQTIVYCLQQHHGIRLMRCTQDGEPSHPIEFMKEYDVTIERPPKDSKLEELVNEWITEHDKKKGG